MPLVGAAGFCLLGWPIFLGSPIGVAGSFGILGALKGRHITLKNVRKYHAIDPNPHDGWLRERMERIGRPYIPHTPGFAHHAMGIVVGTSRF